jgi:hypothetical protein
MSQFPSKGAVLKRGEERVQLRQRPALRRFQLLNRLNSTDEFALQVDGGNWNLEASDLLEIQARFRLAILKFCNLALSTRFETQEEREIVGLNALRVNAQNRDVLADVRTI